MSVKMKFNRSYLDYGPDVRPFETTADVVSVYEDILTMWNYDLGDQIGALFSTHWLGESERPENDPDTLDLIFQINGAPFFEITLQDGTNGARYGGWLFGAKPVVITDEVVDGYRVILTTDMDGSQLRHEYNAAVASYGPVAPVAAMPLSAARRMGLRRAG